MGNIGSSKADPSFFPHAKKNIWKESRRIQDKESHLH